MRFKTGILCVLRTAEAPGARWSSWPSKPLILSFAARMVGSTPTRFRHIFLMRQKLQKNEAAKGGIKRNSSGFVQNFERHG
jgi:hypothetical protein